MIRILNTEQIRELDAFTIAHEPVASIDLMERACRAFAAWFAERIDIRKTAGIVCGTGNNGGDGLGIGRMLKDWNYPVKIWIIRGRAPESEEFRENLRRLEHRVEVSEITAGPGPGIFNGCDILIDAIFGSGISRPAEGVYAEVIRAMNASSALKIAVDMPSGLFADKSSSGDIVRADHTVSFQLPKLCFFLPQSYPHTGEWDIVDIGLDKDFIKNSPTPYYYVSDKNARRLLRRRGRFDHKGSFGHALMVAGSFGKMGAAVLAARAALRSGAGLISAHIPQCGYTVMQASLPEAMVSVDANENIFTAAAETGKYQAIGVGPGLGQDPLTKKAVAALLRDYRKPLVLDADALNILAADRTILKLVPPDSILTPHPKEFERLAGAWKDDFERLQKQRDFAASLGSVVILKGAYTSIATADGVVYFNSSGNPGMATGGTGDVLTGVLTGLLAQGYSARDAAILGVYAHGLAGDLAVSKTTMVSLMASDLVEFLPQAFRRLSGDRS